MQLAIKGNQLQQDLENENGGAASRRFASRKVLGAKLVFDGDDENSGRAVVAPLEVGDLCHSRLMTHLFWHHLLIKPQTSISTRIAIVTIEDPPQITVDQNLALKLYFTILKWYFSDRSSLFEIVRSVSNMSDQRKSLSLRNLIYSCCLPNLKLNLVLRRPQSIVHWPNLSLPCVRDYWVRQELFICHYWHCQCHSHNIFEWQLFVYDKYFCMTNIFLWQFFLYDKYFSVTNIFVWQIFCMTNICLLQIFFYDKYFCMTNIFLWQIFLHDFFVWQIFLYGNFVYKYFLGQIFLFDSLYFCSTNMMKRRLKYKWKRGCWGAGMRRTAGMFGQRPEKCLLHFCLDLNRCKNVFRSTQWSNNEINDAKGDNF